MSDSAGRSYDVVVAGLGAMGSAAVAELARRGLDVLGVEQFSPVHDLGSSHGESRMIRQAYFEHPDYVPLVRHAYELWRELEGETGRRLLELTGGLVIGAPGSSSVEGARSSATSFGLAYELLDAAQLHEAFPTFAPLEETVALYEPDAGLLLAEAAIASQLEVARRRGARLSFGERLVSWASSEQAGGVEVELASGRVCAGRLVVCAGAWAPRLLAGSVPQLEVERQVLHWFEPAGGTAQYLLGRHPVWIWDRGEGRPSLYGFPALDPGSGVKVAFHHGGARTSSPEVEREVSADEVAEVAAAVSPLLPGLAGRPLRALTCKYTDSPDEHFVIGPLSGSPSVIVACGFSGHGFKFAPAVGEALADIACGAVPALLPLTLFDPARR